MEELLVIVTLTVVEGADHEKTIRMTTPVMTVGRRNTKFNLNDTKISSHHLNIEIHGKDVFVIDQNSRNGTMLNGVPVQKSKLKDLDLVELGFTKIQVNIVDNLQAFKKANVSENKTAQKDISSLIDDELDRFSKWDLSSPDLPKKDKNAPNIPFGIEVTKGPDKGKKYLFPKHNIVVGRGEVDCILRDTDVSRKHVMISYDEGSKALSIKDLDSTNGMMLNGKQTKAANLVAGDVVQIGQTLMVIVQLDDGTFF